MNVKHAKRMATCAMMAAVCVVLMLLGGILEVGIYAAPMFAGLCLTAIGNRWGSGSQWLVFAATSVLCLMLVPSLEETLIFIAFFGWYPILRPVLQRRPAALRLVLKLLLFNAAIVSVETLVLLWITPEIIAGWMLALLLLLGNVAFLFYDRLVPLTGLILKRFRLNF